MYQRVMYDVASEKNWHVDYDLLITMGSKEVVVPCLKTLSCVYLKVLRKPEENICHV
jgi:hypothetical protein